MRRNVKSNATAGRNGTARSGEARNGKRRAAAAAAGAVSPQRRGYEARQLRLVRQMAGLPDGVSLVDVFRNRKAASERARELIGRERLEALDAQRSKQLRDLWPNREWVGLAVFTMDASPRDEYQADPMPTELVRFVCLAPADSEATERAVFAVEQIARELDPQCMASESLLTP